MRSQGIPVTDENLFLEREKIMIAVGRFIPGDMRFFHELERADEDKSKMIVFDDGPMQRRLRSLYSPELPESADDEL